MCGSLGMPHCLQVASVAAEVFHCDRRDRVLLREVLRLGTATYFSLGASACSLSRSFLSADKASQRGSVVS